MKKLFYTGILAISLFEILKVYFIMPMPGSQEINSLGLAYFLHSYRWFFRILFLVMIGIGCIPVFRKSGKWLPTIAIILAIVIIYVFNFRMAADSMFKDPKNLVFKRLEENMVSDSSLIIGVEVDGEAKAYPIRYLIYHHKVMDNISGKPIIVTYCSVCRSGRVFEPQIKGKMETFRLVGMDHFNAMFEDQSTKSWWQQATGEAIIGPLKGEVLPEVKSLQLTLKKWSELYPHTLIMQPDESSIEKYDPLAKFEKGLSSSLLTKTDSISWENKSWVIGILVDSVSKAYDWNDLIAQGIINDKIDEVAIVLALSNDEQSFVVFERPNEEIKFRIQNDTLYSSDNQAYNFAGQAISYPNHSLKKIQAYQEFWHSWRTFHPQTQKYSF